MTSSHSRQSIIGHRFAAGTPATGLPLLLTAYASGIALAPFLLHSQLLAAAPPVLAMLWLIARHRRFAHILLPAFFLLLGIALYHLQSVPPGSTDHVRAFVSEHRIALEGKILEIANRPLDRSYIDLEATRVISGSIAARVNGRVRIYIDKGRSAARPGDTIRFRTRLRPTRVFGTPGEFDYPRHLARSGIFVSAFLPAADGIVLMRSAREPGFGTALERRRQELVRFIDDRVSPSQAPLVRALVLGDKNGIPPPQRDLLGRGGVSHLFAISGLHLGLIAGFLYFGGRFLYRRCDALLLFAPPRRCLPPLLLPLLWGYLLLTGSALPTFRAFLMVLAGALLFLGARRTPPLKLLSATAFLILCFDPLALFQPSFQLSFAGVFGILMLLPRWQRRFTGLPRPLRWGATLFGTTLAATIATTPLVVAHFHLLAPAGLVSNLAAVPAIGFAAVPLGLGGVLAYPFVPETAAMLFRGCGFTVENVLRLVESIVALPGMGGWRLYASPLQHAGIALLAGALLMPVAAHRAARATCLVLGLLLLTCHLPASQLAVTALSVGQGDSILVSRSGRHYLIDGGGLYSKTFDVGERLVAPALGRLGVGELNAVMLSHDDPDHRKGLVHILEHFSVAEFWSPAHLESIHPSLRRVLQQRNIPVVRFVPGWTVLEETEQETLAVFAPPLIKASDNDRSLVLYARNGAAGALLTGDLEALGAGALAADPPPGPVSLLKLPHHGSRHSSPEVLLERLQPQRTFVSAGRNNRYGLPHPAVVAELRRRAIPLHRTDLTGTLRFLTKGESWRVQSWERGLFR